MESETLDNEIRDRLNANDSAALEMVWNQYSSDLLGYLVGLHCSRHEAEDTLQDVFVTISRKRASIANARRLKPYLFKLARNVALNRIKKVSRRRERDEKSIDWLELEQGNTNRDERTAQIESALAGLPEKQRTVIVLKFYRDKTFLEIGEMLGISENTAGSRYRYGMEKLRGQLQETS